MKITIVDKLSEDRSNLLNFITEYCSKKQILADVYEYSNGTVFLKEYPQKPSAVVFMGMRPEGKPDGIEITRRLQEFNRHCLVILSADEQSRAVDAYEVRAFDYLLKPYGYSRFEKTMDSCVLILSFFGDISNYITVKESRRQIRILLSDIIYTDYYNHYIQIHTRTRIVRSYLSFAEFSPMLLKDSRFLCCYRNCIVNMDHISRLDSHDFLLDTGERIPIARKSRAELKQFFTDYQFSKNNGKHLFPTDPET